MKLVLEIEGGESVLRSVFEIVEKVSLGVAKPGAMNIEKAHLLDGNTTIVLDPAYDGQKKECRPSPLLRGGGIYGI